MINLYTRSAGGHSLRNDFKRKVFITSKEESIMHKDFWGWSLENVGKGTVETKYLIESITDEKTWNF